MWFSIRRFQAQFTLTFAKTLVQTNRLPWQKLESLGRPFLGLAQKSQTTIRLPSLGIEPETQRQAMCIPQEFSWRCFY